MRDGMPGPGWWIASDSRWYPPEQHPDVRATAAVVVDDAISPASFTTNPTPTSLGASHVVSNGVAVNSALTKETTRPKPVTLTKEKEAFLASLRSTNGTPVVTRDRVETTDTAERAVARPPRSGGQRLAFGVGLALATLLVIVYFARGHGGRPSLDVGAPTSVATTVQTAPATAAPVTVATPSSVPSTPSSSSITATRAGTTPGTSTVTSAAKITPKVVSVFDLVKGNCLDGASLSDGLVTTIRVVDCSEVHTHEVYYSGRYPESTFDANKISTYANDTCLAQFTAYVGIDYTRSRYQYLHIVPTQQSWTRDNDRDVVCVAFDEDGTITGTIAGRAQ
ncbi:MAG: septum formation family protein [Acidimicrobiales bacterium]